MDEELKIDESKGLEKRILLVPKGKVVGRDGRIFFNTDVKGVLHAFDGDKRDIPVDADHELEMDKRGKAYGWITKLEEEEGAIYGVVEWNERGKASIEKKEYRYISPVFLLDKERVIRKIESVGLVNKPNLYIRSLNSEGCEEEIMPEMVAKEICSALNMGEGSSVAEVVAKVISLQAEATKKTAETNSAVNMVPRGDYETVLNRAESAEKTLVAQAKEALVKEANSVIDKAVEEGKIAPASRGYYEVQCNTKEGLDALKEFVSVAPKVVDNTSSTEGAPKHAGANTSELTADELAFCKEMNISEDVYKLGKKER